MTQKLIGIFGGSFDPVHLGHIAVAKQVYQYVKLDEIWFTPCFLSPFKKNYFFSNDERLKYLHAAIHELPYARIWDYEINQSKVSYTYDTVVYAKQHYPLFNFNLILGLDSFLIFPHWYQASALFKLVSLIVVKRPNITLTHEANQFLKLHLTKNKKAKPGQIIWLDVDTPDLASSSMHN